MTFKLILAALAALSTVGCSTFNKGIDYRTASSARQTPLEVPPDLTQPSVDDRFSIPDARPGTATYSTYSRNAPATPSAAGVLPSNARASIVRSGDTRYLKVSLDADRTWPVVKEFWTEMGFVVRNDNQAAGVMETEWAENRARIPLDPIRSVIGRVMDGIYSTSERDKFRARLERASDGGTEVYISHRGVQEIYVSEGKDQTKWQPRPADRELEAEMLNRLMVKFGGDPKASATVSASAPGAPQVYASAVDGGTRLQVNDSFDRAWRRVGLALDRGGFTVEDRDRSKGLFFVRYIDPDFDIDTGEKKGILDKLAFWRSPPKPGDRPAYRIFVAEAGGISTVQVQKPSGEIDTTPTGKRMLTVLADQMK